MISFEWIATSTGFRSTPLGNQYVLEVWDTEKTAPWYAGVNDRIIKDENGEPRQFDSVEAAQTSAERLASAMMRSGGLIDSSGN